jgi:hypothetical protein
MRIDEGSREGDNDHDPGRRAVLKTLAGLGVGTLTFRRALAAQAES